MEVVAASSRLVEERARELNVLNRAVIATDMEGQVVFWNDAAEELYGWSSAEALGKSIADLTPAAQSREEAMRILERLRQGMYWSGEFEVARRDGRSFRAHVIDAPVHDEQGHLVGIIGLSSDIPPITRLQRLARDLSAAVTPADVAETALRASMETVGAAAGWFMVVDAAAKRLTALSAVGHPQEYFERFRHIPLDAPIPIAEVVRTGEPIYIESREEWSTRYPNLVNHTDPRTRCWVSLPMAIGDRIVGAVGLSIRYPRDFPDAERDLLLAITQHAAVAVERATLFDLERQAREEAESARAAAEEANRVKSSFLATMSHELRTPLGAVIGYHDLLVTGVAGPLNPEQHQYLRRLRSSATHLLSLIDEVLSFARLEAARETVHTEEIVLGVLLDDVANIVRPLAQARGLAFTATTADASAVIGTDVQKARQILVNLAGNAVKYTEQGEVSMFAELRDRSLLVSVSDTGPGIAEENIEKIFDPFWQVENSAARRAGGTGLGLSVARKLARLMGGDIDVRSVVGEGSTFTLRLPVVV